MSNPSSMSSSHASTPAHSPTLTPPRSSTPVKTGDRRTPSPGFGANVSSNSEQSPMLDPITTSKLPGAKPPKPPKPVKPPKPANLLMMVQQKNSEPERLTFSEKKRRFEQGVTTKTESSEMKQQETYTEQNTKKTFSYLSHDELEKLKEEEVKKLGSVTDQKSFIESLHEIDEDEEETDEFASETNIEITESPGSHVVRTAKSERRLKEKLKKEGIDIGEIVDLENLTPLQRRALEAEKRAAWRQARLKSLENDTQTAQFVIAKVKEMSEAMEARPVSPKMQVIDIDIDVDHSYGMLKTY